MISVRSALAWSLVGLGVAGCSSTSQDEPSSDPVVAPPQSEVSAEETSPLTEESSPIMELSTVYFDFDSFSLTAATREALRQAAQELASQPEVRVQIEGHCDERGSNEYNLALGEKRARAVEEYLISQGVAASQLSTISYGEERPAVMGSDEESWAQNRRAVFIRL